jgi:hypothetical protein
VCTLDSNIHSAMRCPVDSTFARDTGMDVIRPCQGRSIRPGTEVSQRESTACAQLAYGLRPKGVNAVAYQPRTSMVGLIPRLVRKSMEACIASVWHTVVVRPRAKAVCEEAMEVRVVDRETGWAMDPMPERCLKCIVHLASRRNLDIDT